MKFVIVDEVELQERAYVKMRRLLGQTLSIHTIECHVDCSGNPGPSYHTLYQPTQRLWTHRLITLLPWNDFHLHLEDKEHRPTETPYHRGSYIQNEKKPKRKQEQK